MSWGLRYYGHWKDVDGQLKKASFYRKDYSGEAFLWPLSQKSGVQITQEKGDALFTDRPIISTIAEFGFYFSEIVDFAELIELEFKVEVSNETTSEIEFVGFLEPWDSTRPYSKPKHLVSFTATCGLSRLFKKRYSFPYGQTLRSELQVLWDCLSKIDNGLGLLTSVHISYVTTPAGVDPLSTRMINIYRYREGDSWLKMDAVIEDILSKYSAELVYKNNSWYLISRPDQYIGTHTSYFTYAYNSTTGTYFPALPSVFKQLNYTDGLSLAGGGVSLTHAVRKYTVNLEAGEQREIFDNGDLQIFEGGIFPEWDLSKLPNSYVNGWSREETADKMYPNSLRISGTRPTWLVKKKRWGVLKKKYEVEPTDYIESPVGEFNPYVNGLTISFEFQAGKIKNFGIAIGLWDSSQHDGPFAWVNHDAKDGLFKYEGFFQKEWAGIVITPNRDNLVGEDTLPTYQFSISLGTGSLNSVEDMIGIQRKFNRVVVRFYKVVDEDVEPGQDWYRINWLKGKEGSDTEAAPDGAASGSYETSFQVGDKDKDEEGQIINLITGEYVYGFNGTLSSNDGNTMPPPWRRPGYDEEVSLYYALVMQRLWMTWKHLQTVEATFKLKPGVDPIHFLDIIHLEDLQKDFQILRLQWDDYSRSGIMRLIELTYEEPPEDIEREALNKYPNGKSSRIGAADGAVDRQYPPIGGPQPGSNLRQAFDDPEPLSDVDDLIDLIGKMPTPFGPLPTLYFVAGQVAVRNIDLSEYFNEEYLDDDNEHDVNDFSLKYIAGPAWAQFSAVGIGFSVSGKPGTAETTYLELELLDADSGLSLPVKIATVVYPATKVAYSITPGGPLSTIQPAQLLYSADPRQPVVSVDGGHDAHIITLKGGAGVVNLDTGLVEHSYTETATYTPFPAQPFPEGIFDLAYIHYRKTGQDVNGDPVYTETHRSRATFIHGQGLGDSDPTRRAIITLESAGSALAEITGAETIIPYIEAFNIAVDTVGLVFDKLILTLMPEVEPYIGEMIPTRSDVTGSTSGAKLNAADGTTSPDPSYSTTALLAVAAAERYWFFGQDLVIVGYNGSAYVASYPGPELIIPAGVTHIRACSHTVPVTVEKVLLPEANFKLFPADVEKPAGRYSVFLKAVLEEVVNYEKYGRFQVMEKEPEPVTPQDGLKLITKAGSAYTIVQELAQSGNVVALPAAGFDVLHEVLDLEIDRITWEAFRLANGSWSQINIQLHTGLPAEKSFSAPVTDANVTAFWTKTSQDIPNVHVVGRLKFIFTDWLAGEKVNVQEADFSLKPNVPLGPPSGVDFGYVDLGVEAFATVAGNAPTTGGYYLLDTERMALGTWWSVFDSTWDGVALFDTVNIRLNGIVVANYSGTPGTVIDAMMSEYLAWGTVSAGQRFVAGESIDKAGTYLVSYEYLLGSTPIGTKTITLTLYSEVDDPDVKDPNECCSGEGTGSLEYIEDWT